jgi:integrase
VSYVFHLRAFYRWLVKKNRMHENPAEKVELGKVELVVRKNFESAVTVRALIDSAADDDMRFIYYCGFHAGMRKLEIIEARPDWFRLGDGTRRGIVNIHRTPTFSVKDRDERTVPLSSEFEGFLRKFLAQLPADAEFVMQPKKQHGKAKYRYDFRAPFAEHMRAMKVKCTPHDMRRTFVSLKIIEDSSLIFKLAKWTGTNVKTLQAHYAHLLADDEDIEVGLGDAKDPDANLPRYLKSFAQLVEKAKRMSESGRTQFFARLAKVLPQQQALAA